MAGSARDHDLRDAQFARHHRRMQGAGAAIGDEAEFGCVEAALGGHPAHHMGHLGRGDAQNAVCRRPEIETERRGDAGFERASSAFDVEAHLAAEKAVGGQPPEDEVGIGDGRLGAAAPIAHRTGLRARAFRTDMQRAAHFDARDRAAAGADLLDVDHRHLHRQTGGVAADERAAGHQHLAAMDDAGLGGGAAHVEGDGVLEPDAIAQCLGAGHARRGSGFQHPDTRALRLLARRTGRRSIARSEIRRRSRRHRDGRPSRRDSAARAVRHRHSPPRSRCARTHDIPATARARP